MNSFLTERLSFLSATGVLWLGTSLIHESDKTLQLFRDLGKRVFYVTNNSTKTRDQLVAQFKNLGFEASKVII